MLIENHEVVQWISGPPAFIGDDRKYTSKNNENKKRYPLEIEWALPLYQSARPDLIHKKNKTWSGTFGQEIFKEMCPNGWRPKRKGGHNLDWEDSKYVYEVKTQFYFSGGTAQEKIPGVPVKYMDVPELFGKPLRIICLAGAEMYAKKFLKPCEKTRRLLALWKEEWNIEYVWGSDLIKDLGR